MASITVKAQADPASIALLKRDLVCLTKLLEHDVASRPLFSFHTAARLAEWISGLANSLHFLLSLCPVDADLGYP
jgi:hypothetical protein